MGHFDPDNPPHGGFENCYADLQRQLAGHRKDGPPLVGSIPVWKDTVARLEGLIKELRPLVAVERAERESAVVGDPHLLAEADKALAENDGNAEQKEVSHK